MNRRAQVVHHTKADIKWFICVCLLALLWPYVAKISETRTYRDFFGLTPFSHVTVTTEHRPGELILFGTMRKVRCDFEKLSGFVVLADGRSVRTVVDTSIEDARGASGNRAASRNLQHWGPWVLRYGGSFGPASKFEVFAHHRNCPFGPSMQVNLFASGSWWPADTGKE